MKRYIFQVLIFLLFITTLPAQEASFRGEVLEVRVVDIPVQVTDREGNPIVKLTRSDFRLFEDGREVDITHFFEVKDSVSLRRDVLKTDPNSARTSQGPDFHKRIIIFIDGFHIHRKNYIQLEEALETFLGTVMVPGDRASIYAAIPSVKRLKDWTDDLSALKQVLREFKMAGGGPVNIKYRQRELGRTIAQSNRYEYALMDVRAYAHERQWEVKQILDALNAVIDSNSSVPGEKYLIYVGEGLPMNPGLEYFYQLDKLYPQDASLNEATRFNMAKEFRDLGQLAASHGFTMYLVDGRGLFFNTPDFSAEVSGAAREESVDVMGASAAARSSQDSLTLLADLTGGRAIINTNGFKEAVGKFSLALNHYYSLAFIPNHSRDGKHHTLDVRIDNPEFKISFRKGYRDFLPGDLLPGRLQGVLFWERAQHNPMDVQLLFEKSSKKGQSYLVPIKLLFIKNRIPFENGKADLRIGIITGDEEGRKSDVFVQKLTLHEEMWGDKPVLSVPLKLQMRKGKQVIVVGVEDPFEDISYVRTEINVPVKE